MKAGTWLSLKMSADLVCSHDEKRGMCDKGIVVREFRCIPSFGVVEEE